MALKAEGSKLKDLSGIIQRSCWNGVYGWGFSGQL